MVAVSYFVVEDTLLGQGGGEPSLASREDPYGSLRMPLSICVILRIYNEDAIRVSFLLLTARAGFILSRSRLSSPACHPSPFLSRPLHLSRAWTHKGTFVMIAVASIGQSANGLMSHDGNYCRATQDDVRSFAKRVTTAYRDFVRHCESAVDACSAVSTKYIMRVNRYRKCIVIRSFNAFRMFRYMKRRQRIMHFASRYQTTILE